MEDDSILYTLDEAYSTIGFGKYQIIVLGFAGLGWIAESMEIMLLSFIGPKVKTEWGLSSQQESIITTVVFAGMLLGAFSWGYVSDKFGRIKSLISLSLFTSGAGILSAFSPNYTWLVSLRFIVGLGLGGGHVFSSWFLEFVPAPNRGTWMVIISTFWTIGTIMEAALAWIVMPRFGWRWLLGVSCIPSLSFLMFYGVIPESPRYLCLRGRTDEAYEVLKEMALLNRTKLPSGKLVSGQAAENHKLVTPYEEDNNSQPSSTTELSMLFSSSLIKTTLLLWVVYFGITFAYYGIILLTSELSSERSQCGPQLSLMKENNSDSSYLYINVFVTSCAELPGLVLAALILDKVGRKVSMEIMILFGFVLLLPLVSHQHDEVLTTALLFGARMFISASFTIACIYAPEVYPTSVRSTGVGVATAIGRVGGMISPLVAVALVSGCYQATAIVLFAIILLLVALCVSFFPFETKGEDLVDSVSSNIT